MFAINIIYNFNINGNSFDKPVLSYMWVSLAQILIELELLHRFVLASVQCGGTVGWLAWPGKEFNFKGVNPLSLSI